MGKRKEPEVYNRQSMQYLASYIQQIRIPLEGGKIPGIHANLDKLEELVRRLPKRERERLEKFWGLVQGTINHSKNIYGLGKNAYTRMKEEADEVVKKLISIEYLAEYDENVASMIKNVSSKCNKGKLNINDIDTVKYLIVLSVIFYNGPQMPFDIKDKIDYNPEDDAKTIFDDYAMLCDLFDTFKEAPDNIVNLPLLIEAIEMFDLKDVIAMKMFANIPVSREDLQDFEGAIPRSLQDIRKFKERIFQYGSWNSTIDLILDEKEGFEEFVNQLDEIMKDWKKLSSFKTSQKITITTSKENRVLDVYEIGGLVFTDLYEVMFLCVARNII